MNGLQYKHGSTINVMVDYTHFVFREITCSFTYYLNVRNRLSTHKLIDKQLKTSSCVTHGHVPKTNGLTHARVSITTIVIVIDTRE